MNPCDWNFLGIIAMSGVGGAAILLVVCSIQELQERVKELERKCFIGEPPRGGAK
jgi:hypothetical protein